MNKNNNKFKDFCLQWDILYMSMMIMRTQDFSEKINLIIVKTHAAEFCFV